MPEKSKVELTRQKSEQQSDVLKSIQLLLHGLDADYLRACHIEMMSQASRQEAMSVLNPSYPLKKNKLIRTQAQALYHLYHYIETLQECDQIKKEIGDEQKIRDEINDLFL